MFNPILLLPKAATLIGTWSLYISTPNYHLEDFGWSPQRSSYYFHSAVWWDFIDTTKYNTTKTSHFNKMQQKTQQLHYTKTSVNCLIAGWYENLSSSVGDWLPFSPVFQCRRLIPFLSSVYYNHNHDSKIASQLLGPPFSQLV